jgi:hypothetical protein
MNYTFESLQNQSPSTKVKVQNDKDVLFNDRNGLISNINEFNGNLYSDNESKFKFHPLKYASEQLKNDRALGIFLHCEYPKHYNMLRKD